MSTLNFSGVYTHNKVLTDVSSFPAMGIPEDVLTALSRASDTGTLTVEHSTADGTETIVFDYKTAEAGVEDVHDTFVLGAPERTVEVKGAGATAVSAVRTPLGELEAGLAGGWDKDSEANGVVLVTARSLSADAWTSKMAQGFQEANGERRLVRRIAFTSAAGEKHTACLVFDYKGTAN